MMPIDLHLKKISAECFIKNGISNNITRELLANCSINLENVQKRFPNKLLPKFAKRLKPKVVMETSDQTIVYTGGSKSAQGVEAAFCVFISKNVIKKVKFKLANYCTVFQTELFAINKALEFINKNYSQLSITVTTYSLSALNAIMDSGSQTLLVQEIHRQLILASRREVLISYMWIRGRSANASNELINILAKQAAISHRSFDYDLIPISYLKKFIYDNVVQIWNERWISSEVGGTTRKYFPTFYDRIKCKSI
jgi:ribonuclease HI